MEQTFSSILHPKKQEKKGFVSVQRPRESSL
jgi:hypothetical protein